MLSFRNIRSSFPISPVVNTMSRSSALIPDSIDLASFFNQIQSFATCACASAT